MIRDVIEVMDELLAETTIEEDRRILKVTRTPMATQD
jgi:hypothetical protein